MTRNQVRWAATHDWFVSAKGAKRRMDGTLISPASVLVRDVSVRDGVVSQDLRIFTNFRSLYAWAGY